MLFLHLLIWSWHLPFWACWYEKLLNWLSNIEPALHTYDKCHLTVMYNSLHALLCLINWHFIENFCKCTFICRSHGYYCQINSLTGLLGGSNGKESVPSRRPGFDPWVRKILWRREWQPTPVFLPWRIPRTEELGGLPSKGLQRVWQDWAISTHTQTLQQNNLSMYFLLIILSFIIRTIINN